MDAQGHTHEAMKNQVTFKAWCSARLIAFQGFMPYQNW